MGKIYEVKKGVVKEKDGPDEGKITPLGKDKLSLTIGGNKLEGTHMLPDDKIKWEENPNRVWRRFQDDDGDKNTRKKKKKTNMLNGMWIDKNKDDEPLEKIQEIYSIENEKVTDGENEAPIKISDMDKVEIEKEFQDKKDWKGTHEDGDAIPEDKIDWGGDQVWIRLKHKKIKDLQKKMNDKPGDEELKDLENKVKKLEEEKNKIEEKKKEAEEREAEALKKATSGVPNEETLKQEITKMEEANEENAKEKEKLDN